MFVTFDREPAVRRVCLTRNKMKAINLSILTLILFGAVACDPSTTAKNEDAGVSSRGTKLDKIPELVDRWNALHEKVLTENSRALVEAYEKLKQNPPMDPTGKPEPITTGSPTIGMSVSRRNVAWRVGMGSPAITSFQFHMSSRDSVGLSHISEDKARMVLNVADAGLGATWYLYKAGSNGKLQPRYSDTILYESKFKEQNQFDRVAADALANGGATTGKLGDWSYEARPLRFSDKSCFTCHQTKKSGDLAAVMIYAFTERKPNP